MHSWEYGVVSHMDVREHLGWNSSSNRDILPTISKFHFLLHEQNGCHGIISIAWGNMSQYLVLMVHNSVPDTALKSSCILTYLILATALEGK